MNRLTGEEESLLHSLLSKIENKEVILSILLDAVLAKYMGNRTHTARAMGISLRTLRYWLKRRPQKH